jgi:SAM-dependent methyltransferase
MTGWEPRTNFEAYEDVESFDNYQTEEALRAYRRERLQRHEPYVALLARLGAAPDGLDVVDVGAGSSAFLYALAAAGLLRRGVGVELSASRHAFAERWRLDEEHTRIENVQANFVDLTLPAGSFDRFTAIDDTYLYLRPEDNRYPGLLLEAALSALRPGGILLLDFRNDLALAREIPREGREFDVDLPPTNAFATAHYRQVPSEDRRQLLNESVYVSRSGEERRKVEITEVCNVDALAETARDVGFASVRAYGDLELAPFDAETSPRGVVVATK